MVTVSLVAAHASALALFALWFLHEQYARRIAFWVDSTLWTALPDDLHFLWFRQYGASTLLGRLKWLAVWIAAQVGNARARRRVSERLAGTGRMSANAVPPYGVASHRSSLADLEGAVSPEDADA